MERVERRFVTIGARQVHYRRAGHGPALVLLHESPLSSVNLVELVAALAGRGLCAIALDTPGYGSSDAVEHPQPEAIDYAGWTAEAIEALGVERCAVYGAHTGASIALELAASRPDLVACAVLDGLPAFDAAERADLLANYLPTFPPQPNGEHLLTLWSRYRVQHLHFPWYAQRDETRLDLDMPDPWHLQEGVLDFLRAGDGYRVAYAAAFRHEPGAALAALRVPTAIVAREDDLIASQLDRLGELAPPVEKALLPRDREAWADWIAAFAGRALAGAPAAPAVPATAPVPGRIAQAYADTAAGQLRVRGCWGGEGRPLVMLHASPGSARLLHGLIRRLLPGRPVLALDTLGNGESDRPPGWERPHGAPAAPVAPWDAPTIADYAGVVAEALDALGLDEVDVYGSHTGGCIGIELAILLGPERVRGLVVDGVTLFAADELERHLARYTPPLEPVWDGSHLAFAWQFLRAQMQFWPWYDQTRQAIRRVEPLPTEAQHTWVVELLKSGHTYPLAYRAAFSYPTRERLPLLATRSLFAAVEGDMLAPYAAEAARLAPAASALDLPEAPAGQAAAIAAFLDGA